MAPKRPAPLEEPPAASSSEEVGSSEEEEEEQDDSSSEEEEEEESEKPPPPLPPTPPPDKKQPSKKPESTPTSQPQSSSSSESGSDFDSEPESEPKSRPNIAADPNVKPLASKLMGETPKTTKPRSKPSGMQPRSAEAKAKRPSETNKDFKDSKRAKKKDAEASADDGVAEEEKKPGDDSKKQLFQRLWSEDDEIAILKGMIDYREKKGADPASDMHAFLEFLKKSLHVDVSRAQLINKIRRLKKKFENNLGKGKKGEDRAFSKAHEQKAFDLSKKIWGDAGGSSGRAEQIKSNGNARRNQRVAVTLADPTTESLSLLDGSKQDSGSSSCLNEMIRFNKDLGAARLEEHFIKKGLDLIGGPKKAEWEEEWKKLQIAELELFMKRADLIKEHAKMILEAHKSAEH